VPGHTGQTSFAQSVITVSTLAGSISTGGALVAILLGVGPISGAHLNPAVTISLAVGKRITPRLAAGYVVAQVAGAIAGAMLANAMFELPVVSWSQTVRAGSGMLISKAVATFCLLGVVICVGRTRPAITPLAVAAYIVAAYWFTASTSFANPAVSRGRRGAPIRARRVSRRCHVRARLSSPACRREAGRRRLGSEIFNTSRVLRAHLRRSEGLAEREQDLRFSVEPPPAKSGRCD